MIDYSRLPSYMRDPARRYVDRGECPGSFLSAALANNLVRAFQYADEMNSAVMHIWASWLYNELPTEAWGSEAAVTDWCTQGGLLGQLRQRLKENEAAYASAVRRYTEHGLSEDDEAIALYQRQADFIAAKIARIEAAQ